MMFSWIDQVLGCFFFVTWQKTFENEERGAKDQAEEESSCDKVHKPEKAPRKMLSRGEKRKETPQRPLGVKPILVSFHWGGGNPFAFFLSLKKSFIFLPSLRQNLKMF